MKHVLTIIFSLVIFMFVYQPLSRTEAFTPPSDTPATCQGCANVQEPSHLYRPSSPSPEQNSLSYAQELIDRQQRQIKSLRHRVQQLALDKNDSQFYRKRLSNKYYRPKPFMAHSYDNVMNLHDEDFSNKTLSTIKFLSQTRSSKYFGDEIHFPTELCGSYCSTSDRNSQLHENIDRIRPVTPANSIPAVK